MSKRPRLPPPIPTHLTRNTCRTWTSTSSSSPWTTRRPTTTRSWATSSPSTTTSFLAQIREIWINWVFRCARTLPCLLRSARIIIQNKFKDYVAAVIALEASSSATGGSATRKRRATVARTSLQTSKKRSSSSWMSISGAMGRENRRKLVSTTQEQIRPILKSLAVNKISTKTIVLGSRARSKAFAFNNYLKTAVVTMTIVAVCTECLMNFWSKFSDVMPDHGWWIRRGLRRKIRRRQKWYESFILVAHVFMKAKRFEKPFNLCL